MKQRFKGSIQRYIYRWVILVVVVFTLVGFPWLVLADGVLTTRWPARAVDGVGQYDIVVGGVGTEGTTTGSFTVNVPGTPIVAFLYWAGVATAGDLVGDDTVNVTVNLTTEFRTADDVFGPDTWEGGRNHFVYVEDITSLIVTGRNNITVADFGLNDRNYGTGAIIVYEDPNLPLVVIEIKDGLDSLFVGFNPPQGPNGEVNCFQFDPALIDRALDFDILAGGVSTTFGLRPNALWAQTGVANNPGALPTELIDQPEAFEVVHATDPYPFDSDNGPQWDVLPSEDTQLGQQFGGLPVPAGDNYACFQAESIDDQPPLEAASMLWIALAGRIALPVQPLAALGDFVWLDRNQDGIQDAGEPGVSGVTVNLFDGAGTLVSSTTTDANGFYLFDNLTPGDYFVEFIPPSGFERSPQDRGQNDGVDSDADPATGRTAVTNLTAGERDLTWDAGIFRSQIITDTPPTTLTLTPTGPITITPPRQDINDVTALPSTGYPPSTQAPLSSPARLPLVVGAVVMVAGGLVLWRRRRLR